MSTTGSALRWWQFSLRALLAFVPVVALLASLPSLYYRWLFPYGSSHCCDLALQGFLHDYARAHRGRFPAGEATPEASLSLLNYAGLPYMQGSLLRGKTARESVVQKIFDQGGLLGPDTCGWHYVEGLTLADDPHLALFWDTAGLGHNGQRHSNGRAVCYVRDMKREWILDEDWEAFLEEQRRMLAARTPTEETVIPALRATVQLPSGETVDTYAAACIVTCESRGADGFQCRYKRSSDKALDPGMLSWWQFAYGGDSTNTYTLSLGPWRSQRVAIRIVDGVATPNEFVFVMSPTDAQREGSNAQPETVRGESASGEGPDSSP